MRKPDFDSLFEAAAMEFEAAFLRTARAIRPDEIGGPREEHLRTFLSDWLPAKYGVTHGYVLSLQRQSSRECDVILYDALRCPKFYQDKKTERKLVPLADSFGIIEVKSSLGETELNDALDKFRTFRELSDIQPFNPYQAPEFEEQDIKAVELEPASRYGSWRAPSYIPDEDFRDFRVRTPIARERRTTPFTILFAYRLSRLTLTAIHDRLKHDPLVDAVFVLDSGFIIELSQENLQHFKSMREGLPASHYTLDLEILTEVFKNTNRYSGKTAYIPNESHDSKATLIYFYTHLLGLLNSQKLAAYNPSDLIAVWQKPPQESEE